MLVRIRFARGPQFHRKPGKNRPAALGAGALLIPPAAMAAVMGLWRLTSDLQVTGEFGIANGLFSHWHVWIALSALLSWCAFTLNRYGNGRASS